MRTRRNWTDKNMKMRVFKLLGSDEELESNISRQREAEKKLATVNRYEKMTGSISRMALREVNMDKFLTDSLRILGEGTGVCRAYIFVSDKSSGTMSNIYEWTASDISPQIDNLQKLSEADFTLCMSKLRNREIIKYQDIEDIPEANSRDALRMQDIKSVLTFPLFVEDIFYGFIGFDACLRYRDWEEEIVLLNVAAEIISLYLLQKRREEMLWRENQRFRALTESADDIVFELDREQRHTAIFGRWMEKSGIKPEFFLGRSARDIFGPEGAAIHEAANQKALQGENVVYEWSSETADEIKIYQTSVSPVIDQNDQITGIVGIGRDITSLVTVKKELQQEKELLYTTLLSIGEGVIATDINGNITSLNKVAEEITGWSFEEARGRAFDQVFRIVSEATGQSIADPVQEVLKTGMPISLEDITLLISKQGRNISVADRVNPIIDGKGKIIGAVMVFRDLSREKEQKEKILYLNYHDPLTGLYNRRFMEEQIQLLDNAGQLPLTVIIGDINGLKLTNDVFGYEEGDRLLQQVAATIRENCPEDAVLARWGGDEFLVIIPRTGVDSAEKIIKKIKSSTYTKSPVKFRLSIALGYAVKNKIEENFKQKLKEAEEWMHQQKFLKGKSYRNTIINAMLATLFEKNNVTEEHAQRLKYYCSLLGRELQCSSREMEELAILAMLHDIGKIGIRENVLQKPGPLSPEEWIEMRKHPEIGYRIARNIPELAHVAEDILYHHERWDGHGYPRGLAGEEIPLVCRIVAAVDAYDAMTNERVYRKAMSLEEAMRELEINAGTQFDPRVTEAFLKILASEKEQGEGYSYINNLSI